MYTWRKHLEHDHLCWPLILAEPSCANNHTALVTSHSQSTAPPLYASPNASRTEETQDGEHPLFSDIRLSNLSKGTFSVCLSRMRIFFVFCFVFFVCLSRMRILLGYILFLSVMYVCIPLVVYMYSSCLFCMHVSGGYVFFAVCYVCVCF